MKLLVTAQATQQADEIGKWWRENRGSSTGFIDELSKTLELLKATPEIGPAYLAKSSRGIRRVLLPKSQHYVYYAYYPARRFIRILAIWSCYRGSPPPLPGAAAASRARR